MSETFLHEHHPIRTIDQTHHSRSNQVIIFLQSSNSLESQNNSNSHGMSESSQSQDISSSETSWVVGDKTGSSVRELESSRGWLVGSWGKSKASSNQWKGSREDHDLVGGRSEVLGTDNVLSSTSLGSSSGSLQAQGHIVVRFLCTEIVCKLQLYLLPWVNRCRICSEAGWI
jgi:hypothetical protein